MPVNGTILTKKSKNSSLSDESSSYSSCNSYNTDSSLTNSDDEYELWLNDFLELYHRLMNDNDKKTFLNAKEKYKNGLIKFLLNFDNLNYQHFVKIGNYMNFDADVIYSDYLKRNI